MKEGDKLGSMSASNYFDIAFLSAWEDLPDNNSFRICGKNDCKDVAADHAIEPMENELIFKVRIRLNSSDFYLGQEVKVTYQQ